MAGFDYTKRISPSAINALKEALSTIYWFKSDLRSYLHQSLGEPQLLAAVNWDDYKRNIVGSLVDYLCKNEEVYQRLLLKLISDVCRTNDFSHLKRLEDGQNKAVAAIAAVDALRRESGNLANLFAEEQAIEERRKSAYEKIMQQTAVKEKLEQLSKSYAELLTDNHPQRRGFELERLLRELFAVFDLDPKASFRLSGEQIDGAFTFEGTDYLLEAKWQMQPIGTAELDTMAGKLSRKLDNTLGLFLSINGFSEEGVRAHQTGRRLLLLMDGSDLMAVLEGRIDLMQLLLRKRREASRTGNVYLRIHEILCEQ